MPIPFQMVGQQSARGTQCNIPISMGLCWLTNPIDAALLRACYAGRLGIEFRAFILPDTVTQAWIRATLISLASFTNWLPLWASALGYWAWWVSDLVAMASKL